jgi:hypothetical protein
MPFRFATQRLRLKALSVAFLMADPAFAQAPGPTAAEEPTTIDAESIEGVSDIEITARGKAEIRRGRSRG